MPNCKFCQCVLVPKLCDLKAHGKTKKHKTNADSSNTKQLTIPFQPLRKSSESQIAEGRMALFIGEHTSVSTCDHLNDLCKACFTDSKIASMTKIKRSKCSAILKNVLYPHFMSELKNSVGDNAFSLLIDESTDISINKYLGIALIYHDEMRGQIVSTFLSLTELEECNASGIVAALKKTLHDFGLNIKNLKGLGTDNASVMVGVNKQFMLQDINSFSLPSIANK